MTPLPYLLPYLAPVLIFLACASGERGALGAVVWLYLGGAMLDVFRAPGPPAGLEGGRAWRWAIWLWTPVHLTVLVCGLSAVRKGLLPLAEATVALGITGGMFGVVVAHELMHGPRRWERMLAELLMTILSYPHFCIEHVNGHHRRVGTREDPATARLGESFYEFYPRVILGSLLSAWRIERERLRGRGRRVSGAGNRMLLYAATLAGVYTVVFLIFGAAGLALFAGQGVVAFSLLEAINYVGHYGLTRVAVSPGTIEPVAGRHAWNANFAVSNWLLFNVGRHADHHCHPGKSYERLGYWGDAPQLPAGYLAMFVLALIPPAWRWVMDRRARAWQRTPGGAGVCVSGVNS